MKHLTLDDRIQIQRFLTVNMSFTEIAARLGKNRTTISREVQSYARSEGKPSRSKCKFKCIFENRNEFPAPNCRKNKCSVACSQCAIYCDKYEPILCTKLTKPPYVCNGCDRRGNGCLLDKKLYDAEYAYKQYKKILRESREGVSLSEDELKIISDNIIPLLKNGVSLPTAYSAYIDIMPVSDRTIYDYIDRGVFENSSNMDLRRKLRRKPFRKKSGPQLHVDKHCHIRRTYAEFMRYIEHHPTTNVCEMDSVEGRKGGKVLLTIFFRNCDLQLMYLRDSNTSATVTNVFTKLKKILGDEDFKKVFPVLLGDRGTEFTNPLAIELNASTGEYLCNVFYCDPQQTNQKSRCERNHEYIRYIIPKGTPFDDYTEEDITLVMNNVNSMPRGNLNAQCPIQVFTELYGQEITSKLGLKYIPLQELILKPELLKK